MPRYHYWFRLSPRWIFGLSEPGKVVVPDQTDYTGAVVDQRTGNVLTSGTESVLRKLEDQVNVDLTVAGASVSFSDDVLNIAMEAASPEAAVQPVTDLLNRLLPMVSFGLGQLMSVKLIQATDDAGTHVRFRMETREYLAIYNLPLLRRALQGLPNQLERAAEDSKLSTAVLYFAKGLALEPLVGSDRVSAVRPLGTAFALLASEMYLNYWKALEDHPRHRTHQRGFRAPRRGAWLAGDLHRARAPAPIRPARCGRRRACPASSGAGEFERRRSYEGCCLSRAGRGTFARRCNFLNLTSGAFPTGSRRVPPA